MLKRGRKGKCIKRRAQEIRRMLIKTIMGQSKIKFNEGNDKL